MRNASGYGRGERRAGRLIGDPGIRTGFSGVKNPGTPGDTLSFRIRPRANYSVTWV